MIKPSRELPSRSEIPWFGDDCHQVDVAATRSVVAECQRAGRIDANQRVTEDVLGAS